MNRRDFIKGAAALPAVGLIPLEPEYEPLTGTTPDPALGWLYRVYCYERKQGEWTFSKNIRGSFAYQREYMAFDEEDDLTWNGYCGWMDGGVLHFQTLDDASNFVDMHVRTKDDINLIDSIYDIYFKRVGFLGHPDETSEMHVAHYWFNGDTGTQIHWEAPKPYTDWTKIENA